MHQKITPAPVDDSVTTTTTTVFWLRPYFFFLFFLSGDARDTWGATLMT